MSGHSKWNNIKNRKGKQDAQRGKIFTKLGREILMAVREGGADISANSKLRDVVAKCRANNMPNDTVDKAIKKAAGQGDLTIYEEIRYEGYGPGGVAIIVNATTDNKNRTAGEIRHIFDKFGGNMGVLGCVGYLFSEKGIIIIDKLKTKLTEEELMILSIELEAENFETEEEYYQITTLPENFSRIREELEKKGLVFEQAEKELIPSTYVDLDEENSKKMLLLIEKMEDLDDVLEIYHNYNIN